MPINKSVPLILFGAVASGLVAVYFTHSYIYSEINNVKNKYINNHETVKVVVASHPIKRGDELTYENLSLRDIPLRYTHDSVIRSSQADNVIGKHTIHELNKGEALLSSFISQSSNDGFANLIKEGERAITVPVDMVSSMSGLLRPGNRIDLMLTVRAEKQLTRPLLKNVTVLATGDSVDNGRHGDKGMFQTITVSVTPEDAARITLARNVGTISVVLRSTKDSSDNRSGTNEAAPVGLNNLFGEKTKHNKKFKKVEIIVGG